LDQQQMVRAADLLERLLRLDKTSDRSVANISRT
jgi:hypothetical protein